MKVGGIWVACRAPSKKPGCCISGCMHNSSDCTPNNASGISTLEVNIEIACGTCGDQFSGWVMTLRALNFCFSLLGAPSLAGDPCFLTGKQPRTPCSLIDSCQSDRVSAPEPPHKSTLASFAKFDCECVVHWQGYTDKMQAAKSFGEIL
jgi:hypothetical protein